NAYPHRGLCACLSGRQVHSLVHFVTLSCLQKQKWSSDSIATPQLQTSEPILFNHQSSSCTSAISGYIDDVYPWCQPAYGNTFCYIFTVHSLTRHRLVPHIRSPCKPYRHIVARATGIDRVIFHHLPIVDAFVFGDLLRIY